MLDAVAPRCLIVDDNAEFLSAATDVLQRGGIVVAGVASNAAEALEKAAALRPDVSVVDIDLGEDSGFDLARQLRGIPVILTSAYSEADFADLIGESPAIAFLPKSKLSARAVREALASTV